MDRLIFLIFLLIVIFGGISSNICINGMTINIDNDCFNQILLFNNKNYRAGHFAINAKGDMIVEYSHDHSRLFFGFKKNGRYFFDNENNRKEIENIQNINQVDAYGRFESNNIFVYLEDDQKKEKAYLFSASSYISATELHDLENDNYTVIATANFMGYRIYGFVFSLLEAKINNKNIYFCIFNHGEKTQPDNGKQFSVKKFRFKSFDFDESYLGQIKTVNYNQYNRIVNGFIMEENDIIVVFYMKSDLEYNLNFMISI